jgi:hypothetical protein
MGFHILPSFLLLYGHHITKLKPQNHAAVTLQVNHAINNSSNTLISMATFYSVRHPKVCNISVTFLPNSNEKMHTTHNDTTHILEQFPKHKHKTVILTEAE